MKLLRIYFFTVCLITFSYNLQAQQPFMEQLQQQFTSYTSNTFTEKIYLHVDRNFYMAGELLWFKAYITDGIIGYPSNVSKLAYVEIIDQENKPFLQAKTALANGLGSGSFYIPPNIPSGTYKIRAYTNWMKNFDAAFYFEKIITIVNAVNSTGLPPVDTVSTISVQFFPEGGNLINNLESKIAFRITDKNGKGIQNARGYILADNIDTVSRFIPHHAGIGTFVFNPSQSRKYAAYIISGNKTTTAVTLPVIAPSGITMHLNKTSTGTIVIHVASTETGNGNEVYLFAHTKGVVKWGQVQTIQSGVTQFSINENILGEGITHFTVFNSKKQPVCERLYFKKPTEKLLVDTHPDKEKYTTREKVTINVGSTGIDNRTLPANLSLSVYRLDSLQQQEKSHIYSYLWLGADLKGNIEDPDYYFSNDSDSTNQALDNLMLTHGWRRFKWTDIQQNKKPSFAFLPEFEGHIVEGRLTDTFTKKPFIETSVYLSSPGEYTQFYTSKTDNNGNMRFYTRNIYGPGELVTMAEGLQDVKYNIDINTPFSDKFYPEKTPSLILSPQLKSALTTNSINAQVQRKYAAEQLRKYLLPQMDTSAFYGKADERYVLDDYTRFTTMEEVLREYVLGVLVGRSGAQFHLTVFDLPNNRLFKDNPLLLLDGVPVTDMNKIINYDPLKIKKVEVVKRRYYVGSLLFDGIVNFITYKGNLEEFQLDPGAVVMDFDGMQLQREFYVPEYQTTEQLNNHTADFRNLLYWSPAIQTDSSGKGQVQFYAGDVKGKYIGIIEGITQNGKAGSSSFIFEVTIKK
jgi:hypothetical protein